MDKEHAKCPTCQGTCDRDRRLRRCGAREYLRKISLRRMVTVDDIAAMAFLLSSQSARNVTGLAISVDGNIEYL